MVSDRRILASVVMVSVLTSGWLGGRTAEAAVVLGGSPNVDEIFTAAFDRVGVINPVVKFTKVPGVGDLTVSFGTHFVGQARGSTYNSLIDTTPTGPLRLDPSGTVKTMFDLSSPTGIMLGGVDGKALYTTPLAILFSDEVSYVAFDLGHFDDVNTKALIQVFDAQGKSLGVFNSLKKGHNRYTLSETSGASVIAGVSFYMPNGVVDLEGFGINNIQFAGVIPEPSTLAVWSLLLGCVASTTWWKRRGSAPAAA